MKVTPQASKEPRILRVRSQIGTRNAACSVKLRTCDVSSYALTSESSLGPAAADPKTRNVANLAAKMVEQSALTSESSLGPAAEDRKVAAIAPATTTAAAAAAATGL